MLHVSNKDARKLALSQQGLLSAVPKFGKGKGAVLRTIEHLGYIQIDAISVIQRAHHHTLWTRVPSYQPHYLYRLLARDKQIFEYWSHAAAFLPIKDYAYSLCLKNFLSQKDKHWYRVDPKLKNQVLKRVEEEGPLYARDFETPGGHSGEMWGWKPAKRALHELFMEGRIAIKSRDNFQRLYDITERVIPGQSVPDVSVPSLTEYIWHLCQQAIRAHGLVTVPEIRYQRHISKGQVERLLRNKISQGEITEVKVGNSSPSYYSFPELMEEVPRRVIKQMHFLSPFDNAIIQRKRVKELFDFEYQTEIYYPVHKRRYGYFSLPILFGTDFIGRLDPKAHREQELLEIRNLVLEPHLKIDDLLIDRLKSKLDEFSNFNGCTRFDVTRCSPSFLKSALC